MPEFVSTTIPTSTYSDPLRAHSIKALEQRHKDMLAQAAQAGAITPENTATPIQGFGHLANQLGDSFQRNRVDQAAAAQRQMLAQTIAGMDPNNPKPAELAAISGADPELLKQMLTQMAENRRNAAQIEAQKYGYDSTARTAAAGQGVTERGNQLQADTSRYSTDTSARTAAAGQGVTAAGNQLQADVTREGYAEQAARETARLEADKAAAAEKARMAEEAAVAQENRVQARPTDEPLVTLRRALARGEINQAEFDARAKQLTMPKIGEQEFILRTQKESIENQSALGSLDQALGFLNHPDGIFAGKNADLKTMGSNRLPEALTGLSEKTRENTSSYNKIMGGQALQLLTQMKGASSDKDVKINFDIANDPNATVEEKKRAILVLKEKLAYYTKLNNAAIEGAGGTAPKLGSDPAVKAAADPARAAGTDPAAADKVVDVISEAQAKQLPPGTRFRLPDGRTGRTK